MRWLVLVACSCGGDDGGSFAATVDGVEVSSSCKLRAADTFWDLSAHPGDLSFEFKWKQVAISAPGTYSSAGILSDLVLFTEQGGNIDTATGSVTFDVYDPPAAIAGSFSLESSFAATGTFDCGN